MNPARGNLFSAPNRASSASGHVRARIRHATCFAGGALPKHSQPASGSVNSDDRPAKTATANRWPPARRRVALSGHPARWRGSNHGATRYRYRKRTCVRGACGVTIRPGGVGILSSHGHFGRSVGGSFPSPVVLQPCREDSLRRGHLSRGSGLPAAALTRLAVGFVRLSAPADSTSWATRPRRAVVTRAASAPAQPAGSSGGWTRRT